MRALDDEEPAAECGITTKKGAINGTHHDSGTILLFSALAEGNAQVITAGGHEVLDLPDLFLGGDVIQFGLLIEPRPVQDQEEVLVLFGITAGVPSGGRQNNDETTPVASESSADPAPLAVAVTEVDSTQAQQTVATADAQATDRTVEELGLPDLGGRQTPSPAAIGSALTNIRQQVINAVRAGGNQP